MLDLGLLDRLSKAPVPCTDDRFCIYCHFSDTPAGVTAMAAHAATMELAVPNAQAWLAAHEHAQDRLLAANLLRKLQLQARRATPAPCGKGKT